MEIVVFGIALCVIYYPSNNKLVTARARGAGIHEYQFAVLCKTFTDILHNVIVIIGWPFM